VEKEREREKKKTKTKTKTKKMREWKKISPFLCSLLSYLAGPVGARPPGGGRLPVLEDDLGEGRGEPQVVAVAVVWGLGFLEGERKKELRVERARERARARASESEREKEKSEPKGGWRRRKKKVSDKKVHAKFGTPNSCSSFPSAVVPPPPRVHSL
jgi:hypothetical protein